MVATVHNRRPRWAIGGRDRRGLEVGKRLTIRFLVTLLIGSLVGCGSGVASPSASGQASAGANSVAPANIKVIMLASPAGDDFYFTIENEAKAEATKLGVDLTIQQLATYEASAQLSLLNAAIAAHPDVILVNPLDSNALQSALGKAREQGIKLVLYDNSTGDPSVAATFVSGDIHQLGRSAGLKFKELIGDRKGSVFFQRGLPPVNSFLDALRAGWGDIVDQMPGIKELPDNYSNFEPAKAASDMEAVLAGNPDLVGGFVGIFLDQQGNIPVIQRAGKINSLVLIGLDGAPQNVDRLKAGLLNAIVSVKARDYGVEAIKAAVAAVKGEQLPANTVIGQCVLTKDNLSDPANAACLYDLAK